MIAFTSFNVVPILGVSALAWAMPSLVKPTLPFGVRIPADRVGEPVIAVQRRRYRIMVFLTGVLAAGAAALLTAAGVLVTALPPLLIVTLFLHWVYFYAAHRRIRRTKVDGDWYAGHRQVVAADTTLRTDPPPFPWLWALPAALITAATVVVQIVEYPHLSRRIPVHFNATGTADRWADKSIGTVLGPVLAQVGATALVIGLCLVAYRAPAALDAEQPVASAERHRRYLVWMTRALLILAAVLSLAVGLTSTLLPGHVSGPGVFLVATLLPLAGAAVVVAVAVHAGQSGSRISVGAVAERPAGSTRDDDAYWRGGLFYVNRADQALLVPKRFGIGWTLNFGHPGAWVLIAVIVLFAVVVPVLAH